MAHRNREGHSPRYWRKHPPSLQEVTTPISPISNIQPHGNLLYEVPFAWSVAFKEATGWLSSKLFDWPFVAWFVAAICIGLAYVLAQEHMYLLSRILLIIGGVLVWLKVRHDARKSSLSNQAKGAVSVLTFALLALACAGGTWIISEMKRAYVLSIDRAHLEVEEVTVDIETLGPLWWNLWAHIRGHNTSSLTETSLMPVIKAAVEIRKPAESAEEEARMFSDSYSGAWANETYMKSGHLYPQEEFSLNKHQNLPVLDKGGFMHPGTAEGLRDGTLVVYVLTKARYKDKYGRLPEDKTCWTFHFDTWTGKFKADNCLMVISGLVHGANSEN